METSLFGGWGRVNSSPCKQLNLVAADFTLPSLHSSRLLCKGYSLLLKIFTLLFKNFQEKSLLQSHLANLNASWSANHNSHVLYKRSQLMLPQFMWLHYKTLITAHFKERCNSYAAHRGKAPSSVLPLVALKFNNIKTVLWCWIFDLRNGRTVQARLGINLSPYAHFKLRQIPNQPFVLFVDSKIPANLFMYT